MIKWSITLGVCGMNTFKCDNQKCLSKSSQCNRRDECGDNSDEKNCGNIIELFALLLPLGVTIYDINLNTI